MCKKRLDSKKWGNLLSIWVKACNDEQPIMFYKSCVHNLNFKSEDEVRKLITDNRELFRPISQKTFNAYQEHYLRNPGNFPKILRNENEIIQQSFERLTFNCGFTSQFRRSPNEGKSSKDIIEMGVNYIEKKWELEVKSLEERDRFWGNLIIPALAIVATAIVSGLAIIFSK